MAKQESIAERAARLAGGGASFVPVVLKEKKPKKSSYVKKGGNGGRRAGSGRKPEMERKAEKRQGWQDFSSEEVKVKLPDEKGVTREVKMTRSHVAWLKLFNNVLKGDNTAIKEFNDRDMGRAMQPIGGSDEEPLVLKLDF